MASNNFLVGLDIGTSKVRALAAYFKPDESKLEVVAKASEPSFGVRKGVVVDPETVSKIITSVLEEVEEKSGEIIDEVHLTLGGSHIFSTTSEGTIAVSRADQVISEEDVERVKESAKTFSLKKNRRIMSVFPQEYMVDKEGGIREPVGMKGVRLQVRILVLAYFSPYYENLISAVEGTPFKVAEVEVKPLASAESVLTPREKELGVLLLDMGAGTTSYCIFKEKVLLGLGVVPVGSANITKDIAVGLKTDVETAEKIKTKHASCGMGGRKKIKVREERSKEEIEFSKAQLGRIVDARVKEILDMIKEKAEETEYPDLPGGIVLTGGGSQLSGIKNMSKERLGLATRLGTPQGFFPEQEDPSLAAACGLVTMGSRRVEGGSLIGKKFIKKAKEVLKSLVP